MQCKVDIWLALVVRSAATPVPVLLQQAATEVWRGMFTLEATRGAGNMWGFYPKLMH